MLYRSLFISDIHLGSHNSQAKRLCKFLQQHDAERIYLVGDVCEITGVSWPYWHSEVIRVLRDKLMNDTKIIFIPGNHDSIFRFHTGSYGNLLIEKEFIHEMVDGRRLLVIHGDLHDKFKSHWLLQLLLLLDRGTSSSLWEFIRRHFGPFIRRHSISFERDMIQLARNCEYDGIVCGHVHAPMIRQSDVMYLNSGDWIFHCTAIGETLSGEMEMLYG